MDIIRNLKHIKNSSRKRQGTVLTIGNFDGIHLGHQEIIAKVKEIAQQNDLNSAILTFEPHPASFFNLPKRQDFRLSSLSQKLKILQENEFNQAIILPFNKNLANLEAEEFVYILSAQLNIKYLIIGHDFIFGKNRAGNFDLLKRKASEYDFKLINIAAFCKNDQICSSSLIRQYLKNGLIKEATNLLGRNFSLNGYVKIGLNLGHTLGFPTLNIAPKPHIIQPKFGVYTVKININGVIKSGVMNFGLRPTVAQGLTPLFEIHIFDFNQQIYGQKVNFELIDYIREEKKFPSLDALKQQIIMDVNIAKSML